ncbi:alpha/beta hydrolase family protein [Brochothrix thermosphacta]|uniref:alpha/beta hydrolase family protein n=1 Tax=Brochothrix thermosphacta TaxID=2756 RepID=UPI0003E8753B|nr:prolyl oligopeptidase family serine peptidase [Brochothrix thermosphacta]EUJ36087.1 hypothetical protein BTHER_07166 [Brochothrix thermosphacta DSM 20171 = FSL F6-1036]ODJ50494.1 hypothetical protein BFR34_03310 [Brochothrix thermosphacta DSM 20171 = FSL F6-1036]
MKKYLFLTGIVIFGLIAIIVYTNDFAMTINEDTVKFKDRRIAIEYSEPKSSPKKPGLILFIHGDGPVNKNSDEGYYPAWETLAEENIISVSWDKPGVGNSTGNWLEQDMEDRKDEAERVLKWALDTFDVDPNRVGVWGASQGGWVITKLLNNNIDIKFAIGVAPAVNWMRQGKFNTVSEMEYEGYSSKEINKRLSIESKVNDYLNQHDYQGYLNSKLEKDIIEKDRWDFIRKNMSLDNTKELAKIKKPYYLIVGDHDINVDTKETEEVYQKHITKEYLTVYNIKNATHRMLKPRHQKDNVMTVGESIFNPREIFAPGYLKALKDIGKGL